MALNLSEMWFNGIKIAFFLKKVTKFAQRPGTSPQDLHGLRPPSVIRLIYISLLARFLG